MDAIIERILKQTGDPELLTKLLSLPGADLGTLLLYLFRMRTENISPTAMPGAFGANRFCKPSDIDPAAFHAFEHELLTLAKVHGIEGILLSPAAPLGSCSVFGCVNQNNVVSSLRGTEMLSDPTNMLAIILADRLKNGADNREPLHTCATARVVRAQAFPDLPGFHAHFGLFCMVSAGRASASYGCERELLIKHLVYYRELLLNRFGGTLTVCLRKRGGYRDGDGFWNSMVTLVRKELPDVALTFDTEHEDNLYYRGINFKMYLEKNGETTEIGDGGFVDWMQQMTGSKKERYLISAIGLDRLIRF